MSLLVGGGGKTIGDNVVRRHRFEIVISRTRRDDVVIPIRNALASKKKKNNETYVSRKPVYTVHVYYVHLRIPLYIRLGSPKRFRPLGLTNGSVYVL